MKKNDTYDVRARIWGYPSKKIVVIKKMYFINIQIKVEFIFKIIIMISLIFLHLYTEEIN